MGWSIGYDEKWQRDIGYGVLAICDHPDCSDEIDRGLAYVCANEQPRGGDGCGLYFCEKHHAECHYPCNEDNDPEFDPEPDITDCCERCARDEDPFPAKPDHPMWTKFKLADPSWAAWRAENGHPEPTPELIAEVKAYEDSL